MKKTVVTSPVLRPPFRFQYLVEGRSIRSFHNQYPFICIATSLQKKPRLCAFRNRFASGFGNKFEKTVWRRVGVCGILLVIQKIHKVKRSRLQQNCALVRNRLPRRAWRMLGKWNSDESEATGVQMRVSLGFEAWTAWVFQRHGALSNSCPSPCMIFPKAPFFWRQFQVDFDASDGSADGGKFEIFKNSIFRNFFPCTVWWRIMLIIRKSLV